MDFFPGSFVGFRANELYKVPLNLGDACAMPISQFHFTDPTSLHLKHDLWLVFSYCLFDVSYEGDYVVLGEESHEDIHRQTKHGLDLYRKWEGWRDDEMWVADALETII